MNSKSFTKNICKILILFNIVNILTIFLPIFSCNVSKTISNNDKNISLVRLVVDIVKNRITDIQIITFVIIYFVLLLISFAFISYLFHCIKKEEVSYKKLFLTSLLLVVVTIILMIFAWAIVQSKEMLTILAISGEGSFVMGLSIYFLLISTFLQIILAIIYKKKF